uniref:Uncharacterized protein n=1 Tax=Arundo donax TaxID=35708 RepID=A0A0A9BDH0_ARUDO
MKKLPNLKTMR